MNILPRISPPHGRLIHFSNQSQSLYLKSQKRNDLHLNKPFPTILPILQTNFPNGLLFLPDRMIQVNKERITASLNKLDELAEAIGLDLEVRFPEMKPTGHTAKLRPTVTLCRLIDHLPQQGYEFPADFRSHLLRSTSLLLTTNTRRTEDRGCSTACILIPFKEDVIVTSPNKRLRCLLLSHTNHHLPRLPDTHGQPCEITVTGYDVKHINIVLIQQIHGINHQGKIRRVLSRGKGVLLNGKKGMLPKLSLPCGEIGLGPICIYTLDGNQATQVVLDSSITCPMR